MAFRVEVNPNDPQGTPRVNRAHESLVQTMRKLDSGLKQSKKSDQPDTAQFSGNTAERIRALNKQLESTNGIMRKFASADATLQELRMAGERARISTIGALRDGADKSAVSSATNEVKAFDATLKTALVENIPLYDGGEGAAAGLVTIGEIDLSTADRAKESLIRIDDALSRVDAARSQLENRKAREMAIADESLIQIRKDEMNIADDSGQEIYLAAEAATYVADQLRTQPDFALKGQGNLSPDKIHELVMA